MWLVIAAIWISPGPLEAPAYPDVICGWAARQQSHLPASDMFYISGG